MTLTDAEQAVLDAIDEQTLVDDVRMLVRNPSITGTDNESELQHVLARRFTELDLDVDLWSLDLAALAADGHHPGTEAPRSEGYGLVGTAAGVGEPSFILQGHVDVVPTGDLNRWPDGDPFSGRISGDVLYGRGACDMKAGVAVNLAVAAALQRSGLVFEHRLALHSVISEEDGGLGAFATLARGHTGTAAIITESTSGRIITANAGALTFELEVPGRAAHGSTRLAGVSALQAFAPVQVVLADLEARRNTDPDPLFAGNPLPYGISIGTVHAGDWASSVPDLLVAQGRLGVILDEDPDDARRQFEEAIRRACADDPWLRDHPVRVTWPGGQFASGRLPAGHPLLDDVRAAIADTTGQELPMAAAPYGSDLRLYTGVGIPTLHYGPGDVNFAHAPREQVSISETIAVARSLAVFACRQLGGHR